MLAYSLFLIVAIMLDFGSVDIIVESQFNECYVDEFNSLLKIEKCPKSLTEESKSRENFQKNEIRHEAIVFSKHSHYLEGEGFECSKKQFEYELKTSFLFKKTTTVQTFDIKLARLDCLSMITDNMCHGQPMNCSSRDSCSFKEPRTANIVHPGWWSTSKFVLYECSFRKVLLLSNSYNKNVLPNAIGSCKIRDKKCQLSGAIVVWQDEIIRSCLFERLFILHDLHEFRDITTKQIVFYYSNNQSMLFYLNKNKSTEIDCNGNIFIPTTEGFYLSFFTNETVIKSKLLNLPKSKLSMLHLQEKDYQSIIMSQDDYAIFSVIQKNILFACSAFLNTIRSSMIHDDTFVTFDLGGDKEVIVYFRNGASYLPICRKLDKITVLEKQDSKNNFCFEDIQIHYKSSKSPKVRLGFLRKNGIVTQFSKRIDCSGILNDHSIVLQDIIIKRKTNMKVDIIKLDHSISTQFSKSFWNMQDIKQLFNHHEYLSERASLLENAHELVNSQHQTFVINHDDVFQQLISETKEQDDGLFGSIGKRISNLVNNILNYFVDIVIFIIASFLLILFIILIKYILGFLFSLIKKK